MPAIINDPYASGNIVGSLGRTFGQGLAEQLPKEMERGRLSAGLKKLGEQKDLTPFQQAAALYALPGGAESAGQLLPLLQQQQAAQAYLEQNAPSVTTSSKLGKTSIPSSATGITTSSKFATEQTKVSPVDRSLATGYLIPLSDEEIKSQAAELYKSNPALFKFNPENAENRIAKADAQRLSIDKANEARLDTVQKHFNELISNDVQKKGTAIYADISGDMLNDALVRAQNNVTTDAKKAAKIEADKLFNFVKNKQDLRNLDSLVEKHWLGNAKERRSRLENIRKEYENFGKLEEFKDELVAQGMSQPYSSYIAFPPKDNPELFKYVKSLPEAKRSFMNKTFKLGFSTGEEANIAKQIAHKLGTNDSLFSYALELKQKGYSGEEFLDQIYKLKNEGKIKLTPEQERELSKRRSLHPTLDDILVFSNSGFGTMLEAR